jgi:hypothetical protein
MKEGVRPTMPTAPIPFLLAVGLVGGAAAGVGLERAGVLSPLDEPVAATPAAVQLDRVAVLDCPEGAVIAGLARGDRVVTTGISDDGAWIEIRSPLALDQPAWMAAGSLAGDRALDDLPVHECERVGPTTTTTSSTTTSTSSTTTSTTTTRPAPTTTIPDTAPVLSEALASLTQIATGTPNDPDTCFIPPGLQTTAQVSVRVTDERPGVSVTMTYETISGGQTFGSGSLSMAAPQDGVYTGVLGPLAQNEAAAGGPPTTARVTVLASDSGGHQARTTTEIEVIRCQQ